MSRTFGFKLIYAQFFLLKILLHKLTTFGTYRLAKSRNSSVGMEKSVLAGRPGFDSGQRLNQFWGGTQPPIKLVPVALFSG
jgi:hypothetical protein